MEMKFTASTTPILWPGMSGTPEVTERTELVLSRSRYSASRQENCFGEVRRKSPTNHLGPFGLIDLTDHLRTDVYRRSRQQRLPRPKNRTMSSTSTCARTPRCLLVYWPAVTKRHVATPWLSYPILEVSNE